MKLHDLFKKIYLKSICLAAACCVGMLAIPETAKAATDTDYDYIVTDAAIKVNPADKVSDAQGVQSMLNKAIGSESVVTIYFPAGTYYIDNQLLIYSNTHLVLHKDAVIYRMDSSIDRPLIRNVDQNGDADRIGGYDMSKNITIEGGTWNGGKIKLATQGTNVIRIDHAENITIKNCTVKNTYDCHIIELVGVKNGTISGCTLTGFRYRAGKSKDYNYAREAIQLESAWTNNEDDLSDESAYWAGGTYLDGTSCKQITVKNNTFTNLPCGVGQHHYTQSGKYRNEDITITNNTFNCSSDMKYCKTAITCCGTNNLTVTNNKVNGPYRFAAYVYHSDNVAIQNNTIKNISINGIMVDEGDGVSIKGNTISSIKKIGISIGDGVITEISDNKLSSTNNIGISVAGGTVTTIQGNTIKNAKKHGISVAVKTGGAAPTVEAITGNKITGAKQNGICISAGTITSVSKNTITNAGQHGISLTAVGSGKKGATIADVTGNTITASKKNGISVDRGKITNISKNTIKNVGQHGISVAGTAKTKKQVSINNITGNKITKPKNNGISVSTGTIPMISKNTIKNAGKHGISVIGVSTVGSGKKKDKGILNNVITTCKNNGILVSEKAKVSAIAGNKVTGAKNVGIALTGKAKVQWVIKNTVKKCKKRGIQNVTTTKTKIQKNKGQVD